MKTIKEWFDELPEPIKSEALFYLEREKERGIDISLFQPTDLGNALSLAFNWAETDKDYYYWEEIYNETMSSNILIKHNILQKLLDLNPEQYTSQQIIDELTEWIKNL